MPTPAWTPSAALVPTVEAIDAGVTELAGATKSRLGTGGMRSKLKAAGIATSAGVAVVMANGSSDGVLDDVFAGRAVGTLFLPQGSALPAWKRWLGYTAQPRGQFTLDAGAVKAVAEQSRSLLPVGVRGVRGDFGKGDVVALLDESGREFARGLTNYAAADAARLAGTRSADAALPYPEMIHRDNLVVVG